MEAQSKRVGRTEDLLADAGYVFFGVWRTYSSHFARLAVGGFWLWCGVGSRGGRCCRFAWRSCVPRLASVSSESKHRYSACASSFTTLLWDMPSWDIDRLQLPLSSKQREVPFAREQQQSRQLRIGSAD